MEDDSALKGTLLFEDIQRYLASREKTRGDVEEDRADVGASSEVLDELGSQLSSLFATRAVTMALLFFIVQILIRVYQYSQRLAAFWSRERTRFSWPRIMLTQIRRHSTTW